MNQDELLMALGTALLSAACLAGEGDQAWQRLVLAGVVQGASERRREFAVA
jgi:hypothetical protein